MQRRAAAIGHELECRAGLLLERQPRRDRSGRRPRPRRRSPCRPGLEPGDQLLHVVGRQGLAADQPLRRVGDQRDRLEILHHVVGQILRRGIDDVGLVVADGERVAVGRRARDAADADAAAGAGDVLDDDGLAERGLHPLGHDAGQRVGRPAGGVGHDDGDRTRPDSFARRRCPRRQRRATKQNGDAERSPRIADRIPFLRRTCGAGSQGRRFRLPLDPIWYKIASTTGTQARNLNRGGLSMNLKQVLYSTVAVARNCRAGARVLAPANAQPKPRTASITAAVAIDADDIGGVVTAPNGAGSRRLGDRRDHRSADPLHPERRHRRPGPLRHSRPADRELSGLGARLWPGRLAEDARQARPAAQSHRGARADARPRPRIIIRRSTGT